MTDIPDPDAAPEPFTPGDLVEELAAGGTPQPRQPVPVGQVVDLPDGRRLHLPDGMDPEVVRLVRTWAAGHHSEPIDPGGLNLSLLTALGLDPDQVNGARLTIQGGMLPVLEVWYLPPNRDGQVLNGWVEPLAMAAADTTHVMLPGADKQAPPAQGRQPLPGWPVTPETQDDFDMVAILTGMADALNGAYIDGDTRDLLTDQARKLAGKIEERLYRNPTPNTPQAPDHG